MTSLRRRGRRLIAAGDLAGHPIARDATLLVVRLTLAWIFTYYGAGKLFGAFNGPGLHRSAEFFAGTAHLHPGGLFAVTAGVIELGGATCVAVGVATRLAALALLGDQVTAIVTVTGRHGINSLSATPGYEFNLTLVTLALVVVVLGAGRFSLDRLTSRRRRAGPVNSDAWAVPSPERF